MPTPSAPPLLVYTVLRLGLFVVVLGIVSLFARGLIPLVLAGVISFVLSYVLLRGPRERLAQQVAERADLTRRRPSRLSRSLDDDARAEDVAADDMGGRSDEQGRRSNDPPRP